MKELKIYADEKQKEDIEKTPQKNAITDDSNILVSASAGCGKTFTLVYRILAELGRGTPIRKILVLVFNEAAGEELRDRLAQELYKQILLPETEETQYFRAAIDDLPNAHIGTTHSFCANMIRQYFDKVDISPTFGVATEDAADILANLALDEVLDEYFENQDEVFLTLSDIFASSRGEDTFKKVLTKIYNIIDARPDKQKFIDEIISYYDSDFDNGFYGENLLFVFRDKLRRVANEINLLKQELELVGPGDVAKYQDIFDNFSYIGSKIDYFNTCPISDIINTYDAEFVTKRAKPNTGKDPLRAKCAVIIKAFKDIWKDFFEKYNNNDIKIINFEQNKLFVGKLIEMVLRFEEKYTELKKARNVLTFNDLEHKMVELLNVYGEELKKDFEVLFVDEYQDVNPTQEEIYSRLVNRQAFFVGDVKQAIYEFRLADPKIFLKRKEEYAKKEGCEAIKLDKNFRSNDGILNFVNEIFTVVMTKENSGIDYEHDGKFSTLTEDIGDAVEMHFFAEPAEPKVEKNYQVYKLSAHKETPTFEKVSDMEGNFIAKTIKETVGIKKKSDGDDYKYSDIVILFRKRGTTAKNIINILKKESIPLDCGSFLKGSSSTEKDIMHLLRIIDNPRQDIPLAGFMLSVMGGFDEKELMEISADVLTQYDALYDKVVETSKLDTPLGHKVEKMLKKIQELRTKASIKTVAELIRTIVADFSYDAYLMKQGDSEAIELNSFIEAIESIDENNDLSKFVSLYSERNNDFDTSSASGGNRVRIATYHAFKGLEAPMVFLPGLDEKAAGQSGKEEVVYNNNGMIALDYYDTEKKTKTDSMVRNVVEEYNKYTEETSDMRLFYVALTRAKEKMYLLASVGSLDEEGNVKFAKLASVDYKNTMLDFIAEYMYRKYIYVNNGRKLKLGTNVTFHTDASEKQKIDREEFVEPEYDDFMVEEIIKDGAYIYPHEESTKLSSKYSVTGLNKIEEENAVPEKFERKTNLGTYAHKVMELIDFNAKTAEEINKEKKRMVDSGEMTSEQVDALKTEDIVEIMKTNIMEIARHSNVRRELMFTMYVPAKDVVEGSTADDKVLVQGVIDLLIENENGVYIVDYKLSNRSKEDLKQRYSTQLKLYKKAYESATGKKVDHIIIVSLVTGEEVEID